MRMARWMRAIAPVGLAVCLAGCGVLTPATPTPEPTTVRFVYLEGAADYGPLVEEFSRAHPSIQIELAPVRGGGTGQLGSAAFDAARWDVSSFSPELQGNLTALDSYISTTPKFPADFLPGVLETLQMDGKQFGIPAGLNPYVAYYQPELFERTAAPLPGPQWTLDDFIVSAALANNQQGDFMDAPFSIGFCGSARSFDPLLVTYLRGGNLFDRLPDPTRPTLNTDANIQALQWYVDLALRLHIFPDENVIHSVFGRVDPALLVASKKCATWFGLYSDAYLKPWGKTSSVTPVMRPLPAGTASVNMASMDAYFIPANAAHPDQAWEWIAFVTGKLEAAGGMVPPLVSQAQSRAFEARAGSDAAAVARNLPASLWVLSPKLGNFELIEPAVEAYWRAAATALAGETDPASALNAAQAEVEDAMLNKELQN